MGQLARGKSPSLSTAIPAQPARELDAPILPQPVAEIPWAHIRQFLIDLGVGFAFVGQQYPIEVGGEEFVIDLKMPDTNGFRVRIGHRRAGPEWRGLKKFDRRAGYVSALIFASSGTNQGINIPRSP